MHIERGMRGLNKSKFLELVKQTDFPKNLQPISLRGERKGKMSRAYTEYLKKKNGKAPTLGNTIYNPNTKRIVALTSVANNRHKKELVLKKRGRNNNLKGLKVYQQGGYNFLSNYESKVLTPNLNQLKNDQMDGFTINLDEFPNTKSGVNSVIGNLPYDKNYRLGAKGKFWTLNETNMVKIYDAIEKDQYTEQESNDSFDDLLYTIKNYNELTIERLNKPLFDFEEFKDNPIIASSFFPYTCKLDYDLSAYGIHRKLDAKNYNDCCLVEALTEAGVAESKITAVRTRVKVRSIPKRNLTQVADLIQTNIVLTRLHKQGHRTDTYKYPMEEGKFVEKYDKTIRIGEISNHYFAITKTNLTAYAFENYEKINHIENWNLIKGLRKNGVYHKDKSKTMDSLNLIKRLVRNKNKYLEPITRTRELYKSTFYDEIKELKTIEYEPDDIKDNLEIDEEYMQEKEQEYLPFFIDFETMTKGVKYHTPYQACYTSRINVSPNGNRRVMCFNGLDCGKRMLKHISDTLREYNKKNGTKFRQCLIAHNMRYDWRFIRPYIYRVNSTEPNGRFISATAAYYHGSGEKDFTWIKIKCSYAMIPEKLEKFKNMFNIKTEKDVMPYGVYTPENLQKTYVDVEECLSHLKKKNHAQFIKNCEDNNFFNHDKTQVCLIDYSRFYCEKDVEVLMDGYEQFRQQIFKVCKDLKCKNLDIYNFNTIARLANEILTATGCYVGIKQVSGVVQEFIAKCKVGGRTMTRNNRKVIVNKKMAMRNGKVQNITRIANLDACSLYPSAMSIMKGFLKGSPKVITAEQLNYEYLQKQDGFIIEIKITKVGKKFKFPLQSLMVDGVRNFTNNLVGETIVVDNIALEDFIKFQKVEFEIIRGYLYNEGFNDKVCSVIKEIYALRKFYKKKQNPIEKTYKLLMNSSYGYSLLKPPDSDIESVPKKEIDQYVNRNYTFIKNYELDESGRCYRVEKYTPIAEHFNNAIAGVQILSMSKRLMNEVMCLVEDLNIPMYYQDTDSIHLDMTRVEELAREYGKIYGKELLGNDLTNFNSDFEIKGCKEENIWGECGIYLGKKCYLECIKGIDDDGNEHLEEHMKMKGITEGSIHYKCKQLDLTSWNLYKKLFNGTGEEFDLLTDEDGDEKCRFKFRNNYTIANVEKFKRFITFDENVRTQNQNIFGFYKYTL